MLRGSWVAQATGLARRATRRTERGGLGGAIPRHRTSHCMSRVILICDLRFAICDWHLQVANRKSQISTAPIQNHLARLPGGHHRKRLLVLGVMEAMRDHRIDVQAAL